MAQEEDFALVDELLRTFADETSNEGDDKEKLIAQLRMHDIDPVLADNDKVDDVNPYSTNRLLSFQQSGVDMTWAMIGIVAASIIFYFRSPGMNAFSYLAHSGRQSAKTPSLFIKSNLVHDYYMGNLDLDSIHNEAVISIVLLYSTWSTESIEYKRKYENIASNFVNKSHMTFFAVNCFTQKGLCQEKYKIPIFPMIVASTGSAFMVYKGPIREDQIKSWISNIDHPYHVAHSFADVNAIRERSENVLLGYFRFKDMKTPPGFTGFYNTALLYKKGYLSDQMLTFCLITDQSLARRFNIDREGVSFFFNNDLFVQYPNNTIIPSQILTFIEAQKKRFHGQLEYLDFDRITHLKSTQLSTLLDNSALVMLVDNQETEIAAHNALYFAKIASDYWNCNDDYISPVIPDESHSIKGFGCSSNNSMKFVHMNGRDHDYIVQKLGLLTNKANIIIIDQEIEFISVLNNSSIIITDVVREFIHGYYNGLLQKKVDILPNIENDRTPKLSLSNKYLNHTEHFVIEKINSSHLQKMVDIREKSGKDRVVFLSGGNYHGFSTAVLPYFHEVAHYFKQYSSYITFHILDVSQNQLPYTLDFPTLPVIIFIPSYKNNIDTFVFPVKYEIRFTSLLNFILYHASPQLFWSVRLNHCSSDCISLNAWRLNRLIQKKRFEIRRSWFSPYLAQSIHKRVTIIHIYNKLLKLFTHSGQTMTSRYVNRFVSSKWFCEHSNRLKSYTNIY